MSGSSGRETPQSSVLQLEDDRTLVEELKLPRGSNLDPIPAPLFRKYESSLIKRSSPLSAIVLQSCKKGEKGLVTG